MRDAVTLKLSAYGARVCNAYESVCAVCVAYVCACVSKADKTSAFQFVYRNTYK